MLSRLVVRLGGLGLAAAIVAVPAAASQNPPSQEAPRTAPLGSPSVGTVTTVPRIRLRAIPELVAGSVAPKESVSAFIDRASVATVDEHEAIRAAIVRARSSVPITRALATSVMETRTQDFTRTLTSLSILGELRNPTSEAALTTFVRLPLPTTGHLIEGQIAERITLEELQMKAVQGLAYARTATGDAEVLRIVATHPSRAVRAEAIQAYLFNHAYSPEARAQLAKVVHADETVFLDRPHMISTTTAGDFNGQLATYLRLHPELKPPAATNLQAISTTIDREKDANALKRPLATPPPR
jgi:hypothetical protein